MLFSSLSFSFLQFDIKCYGYSGIKDAIKYEINVTNPITFLELYQELGENLYSFDILENFSYCY